MRVSFRGIRPILELGLLGGLVLGRGDLYHLLLHDRLLKSLLLLLLLLIQLLLQLQLHFLELAQLLVYKLL